MLLYFIRHGKTKGNIEKRYIGRTDEGLCAEGIKELKKNLYPPAGLVISSPMKRCLETAAVIYPDIPILIEKNLMETDFGEFEGKNYEELKDDPYYRKWLDSNGTLPFPKGESVEAFKERSIEAFKNIIKKLDNDKTAFIVHGGTIMALLSHYAKGSYYDYHIENAKGYIIEFSNDKMKVLGDI